MSKYFQSYDIWEMFLNLIKIRFNPLFLCLLCFTFFYTNITFEGAIFKSQVKRVDIEVTPHVWKQLSCLKYKGFQVCKGNTSDTENDKVDLYDIFGLLFMTKSIFSKLKICLILNFMYFFC